ncbi:MAG: PKD domain-containing protein [Flavobacterium sp.]|nr:PKD domain-containing protein [Flavobacterium sp.]
MQNKYCLVIFDANIMIKYLQTLFLLLLCGSVYAQNGCTVLGQKPNTAFPVCGATVFNQSTVPNCTGASVPVPPCGASGGYTDVTPYWYKFTCFKTGTLGFLIQPISSSDDYDWQIFDVTGKNPSDVYTDATMFVSCNWSSNGPLTGANATGSNANNCAGPSTSNISSMPTLTQGHDYLLLVSNYSSSQKGYQLSFGGGTASITDTVTPKFSGATVLCTGQTVGIKLNKAMKCISLTANGSDFSISNASVSISNAVGVNCTSGFNMDSIVLTLNTPLPPGYAYITAQNGVDGNTILDICDNGIAVGDTIGFVVVSGVPATMDSLSKAACAPKDITIKLNDFVRCSSIAADGSDFAISGPALVSIAKAVGNCNANGLTNTIVVSLAQSINTAGLFTISLKKGVDGNTIVNNCSKETPIGSMLTFTTIDTVSAKFTYKIDSGCVNNTVHFKHNGNNGTNSWLWNFSNGSSSTQQNADIILPNSNTTTIKLTVSNGVCTNSYTEVLVQKFDTVKAIFSIPASICPTNGWSITNTSTGNITSYNWDFGNGTSSTLKNPLPYAYPTSAQQLQYAIRLVVANALGCTDTLTKTVTVKANLPAILDSVSKAACKPQQLVLYFSGPIDCSSIAADGSDFNIIGTSAINIVSAAGNCNNASLTNSITVNFSQPVYTVGSFAIYLKRGSDGNVLINDCGVESLAGGNKTFATSDTVNAQFTYNNTLGCNNDNIQFMHNGNNGVNKWDWKISDGRTSELQNPLLVFPNAGNFTVQLTVNNGACWDVYTTPIALTFDTVKAIFEVPEYICPNEPWLILNTSTGKIVSYAWDFGNGVRSALQNPANISYPIPTNVTQRKYTIRLIVANNIGCTSTTSHDVAVLKSCYIAVPTGFTPNNDGLNDYLGPLNAYKTENLQFKVFNRMGNVVFETTDWQKKWDGRINGILQPSGTYVWYLAYTDTDTKKVVNLNGTSVLIR